MASGTVRSDTFILHAGKYRHGTWGLGVGNTGFISACNKSQTAVTTVCLYRWETAKRLSFSKGLLAPQWGGCTTRTAWSIALGVSILIDCWVSTWLSKSWFKSLWYHLPFANKVSLAPTIPFWHFFTIPSILTKPCFPFPHTVYLNKKHLNIQLANNFSKCLASLEKLTLAILGEQPIWLSIP